MLIHQHNGRAQKVFITEIAMCSWHKKLFQPKLNTKKTLLTWNVKWRFTQKACLNWWPVIFAKDHERDIPFYTYFWKNWASAKAFKNNRSQGAPLANSRTIPVNKRSVECGNATFQIISKCFV